MRLRKEILRWRNYSLVLIIILSACVEEITFDVPATESQLVIEGMISDNPGPYTVTVSKAFDLREDSLIRPPVRNAVIKLFDDLGNEESFEETSPGVYQTTGNMRGQVGRAYHITVETSDGKSYNSIPDTLRVGGEVTSINHEFEARTTEDEVSGLIVPDDVFNIYVDANVNTPDLSYVRWLVTGTYEVFTNPELKETLLQGDRTFKDPWPCSGYIVIPFIPGGKLEKVEECSCCTCWVTQFEKAPQLSDTRLIAANKFQNFKVAEVPITRATFHQRYLVEIQQMSLSEQTFNFFQLVRQQKTNSSNLFQPPSSRILGNIKSVNGDETVLGIFWASSVTNKSIFIDRSEVPYPLVSIFFSTLPCNVFYPNSTTERPEKWE